MQEYIFLITSEDTKGCHGLSMAPCLQKKNVIGCCGDTRKPAKTHANCDLQVCFYHVTKSLSRPIFPSIYLSFFPYIQESIYLSIHLTVYVSISLSIDLSFYVSIFRHFSIYIYIYIYTHMFISICIYIYIYSDPKVDRIFFWRVRNLCWNSVGCWPKKKNK